MTKNDTVIDIRVQLMVKCLKTRRFGTDMKKYDDYRKFLKLTRPEMEQSWELAAS